MGLYDNVVLPETFDLPEFQYNPRFTDDGQLRLWQTKDLLRGQDRYRLRPFESPEPVTGTHQLERRVPPIQKMTRDGNEMVHDDAAGEFLWWNVVRPTVTMQITEIANSKWYKYEIKLVNGTVRDVRLVEIDDPRFIDQDDAPDSVSTHDTSNSDLPE